MSDATPLTAADERALAILAEQTALVGPGYFGDLLWGERGYHGSNCSCPYARPAGKVLNRLKAAGLAEWVHEKDSWGWRATAQGRRRAA
jgi:hypothetical protein